jgi:hypothetical protein
MTGTYGHNLWRLPALPTNLKNNRLAGKVKVNSQEMGGEAR